MSSKVIDVRAGDRWTRFRDRSGMVMRDVDGNVLLVGRDMLEPVRIFESSIVGELEDLPTPEAHAQLREWGYEVMGDDVPTGRLAEPTIEPPLTESRVREIVGQELVCEQSPMRIGQRSMAAAIDKLTIRVEQLESESKMDDGLSMVSRHEVREIVEEVLAAKAKPAPGEVVVHATPFPQRPKPAAATSAKPRIDLRDGDTWREFGGIIVQVRGGQCRNCETSGAGEWFDSVNMRNRPEMLPATAVCRLAAMGYEFDDQTLDGTRDVQKAGYTPAPAPDDWRARCRVYVGAGVDKGFDWVVVSPTGWHYLSMRKGKWISAGTDQRLGRFPSEASARLALAAAPPPPDVSPEPDGQGAGEAVPAVPEWAKLLIQAAVDARAYLAKSQSCREANALRLGLDIALSSARTNLAAKGGK